MDFIGWTFGAQPKVLRVLNYFAKKIADKFCKNILLFKNDISLYDFYIRGPDTYIDLNMSGEYFTPKHILHCTARPQVMPFV